MPERSIVQEKRPKMYQCHPDWWHNHGSKLWLNPKETSTDQVVMDSNAARLTIAGLYADLKTKKTTWVAQWEIAQFTPTGEVCQGRTSMDIFALSSAFGLESTTPLGSEWLIERYGGTCAEQSTFIRYNKFLNIPCPGTGHDGDPNISLELDAEIGNAIIELILLHKGELPPQVLVDRIRRRSLIEEARIANSQRRLLEIINHL